MNTDTAALEARLAVAVRSYLDSCDRVVSEPSDPLREVANALAWLLGALLEGNDGWRPDWWIDDLLRVFAIRTPGGLKVEGLIVWGDKQWVDPFVASVTLPSAGNAITGYELKFGNAAYGLGRVGYEQERRPDWDAPAEWIFEFSKVSGGD